MPVKHAQNMQNDFLPVIASTLISNLGGVFAAFMALDSDNKGSASSPHQPRMNAHRDRLLLHGLVHIRSMYCTDLIQILVSSTLSRTHVFSFMLFMRCIAHVSSAFTQRATTAH